MSVHDYWLLLRRWWALVLTLAVLGGVAGVAGVVATQGGYQGSTRIFARSGEADNVPVSQTTLGITRMRSYADLVTSTRLAERIVQRLGLTRSPEDLAASLTPTLETGSVVMGVTVKADSEQEAEAILRVFPQELTTVANVAMGGGTSSAAAFTAVDDTTVGRAGSLRTLLASALLGGGLGLVAGLLLVAVRTRLNPKVGTPDLLSRMTDAPLVGVLPKAASRGEDRVLAVAQAAPDFHRLAHNLDSVLHVPAHGVVAVTGGAEATGLGAVAVGVARALAERGRSVLLVDASGEGGSGLAGRLGVASAAGQSPTATIQALLEGSAQMSDVARPVTDLDRLDVVDATEPVFQEDGDGSGAASLSWRNLRHLLDQGRSEYDVIIVKLPAVDRLARAGAWLDAADAMLYVVDLGASRERTVLKGVRDASTMTPARLALVIDRCPQSVVDRGIPAAPLTPRLPA